MRNTVTAFLFLLLFAFVTFAQETKQEVKSSVNSTNGVTATTYDFTTGNDKFYGGTSGAAEVQAGVWGMVAGDANGDGQITSLDYDLWLPEGKSATTGYSATDMNLDGQNTSLDYDLWLPNAKSAKTSQVPN